MRAAALAAIALGAASACFDPDLRRATCGPDGDCPVGTTCPAGPGSTCKAPEAMCAAERDAAEARCLDAIDPAAAAPVGVAERECRAGTAAAVFAACCAVAPDQTCGAPPPACDVLVPALEGASPADDYNAGFTDYAQTGAGWTGGSGAYALRLDDERLLWMFGYAFLGPVEGQSRPRSAPLLDSAFVVQSGAGLATLNRSPLVVDTSGAAHYVPGDGILTAAGVDVVFHRHGSAGFEGSVLARFAGLEADQLAEPAAIMPLPSSQGIAWGTSLLPSGYSEDGHTYIYGVEDRGGGVRHATVARVAGDDLLSPWQFATADGAWSPDERDAARRLTGIAPTYSVQRAEDKFLMISHDAPAFSATVVARASCRPEGPFTASVPVFETVEGGADGTYGDPQVYTYNARGHADLSHGNQIVMSYNVNGAPDTLYTDVTIYRPRFVRLSFFYTGN
jgi:hypothetical protein